MTKLQRLRKEKTADAERLQSLLLKSDAEAKELRTRYALLLEKQIVLTEVLRAICKRGHTEHIAGHTVALISMWDESDDWWQLREHHTIAQWIEELKVYRVHQIPLAARS